MISTFRFCKKQNPLRSVITEKDSILYFKNIIASDAAITFPCNLHCVKGFRQHSFLYKNNMLEQLHFRRRGGPVHTDRHK